MRTQTQEKINTVLEEPKSNGELVRAAMSKATTKGTLAGLKHTDIQTVISGMKAQIAQALPKHITADRIIQMAVTLISRNEKIAKCSAQSLIGALMQASILGFEPVSALGQCYFVPRNNKKKISGKEVYVEEVEFQIGYKGYIKLAQNSSEIKMIYAEVVKEGDQFEFELGLEPKLKHIPNPDSNGSELMTHVYAVVHYKSGGYNFVVLTRNAVELLRRRSPSQKNGIAGPWATDYEAMAKAKAIKQLAKYMPLSIEIQKAFITDEAVITENSFTNNNSGIDINNIEFTGGYIEEANFSEQSQENGQVSGLNGGEKNA